MRVLVVGDIHLTHRNLKRSKLLLDEIQQVIEDESPEATVLLGDVFDTHRTMYIECVSLYQSFLDKLVRPDKVYHIVGNHEMADSNTLFPDHHAVKAFVTQVNVVDKPIVKTWNNVKVGLMPYVPTGRFNEVAPKADLIFCHQEFADCFMRAGVMSEKGDRFEKSLIISGHIHGEQKYNNIWYPGTPCQQAFDESEDKFVYIIKVEKKGYSIEKKISLNIPKMKTIQVDAADISGVVLDDENEYRVVITGTKEDLKVMKDSSAFQMLQSKAKIKLNPVSEEANRTEIHIPISFAERLLQLAKENSLEDVYEIIAKQL